MYIISYMMITDIGQLHVGYLKVLEQNCNYETNQLKYKMAPRCHRYIHKAKILKT